MRALLLPRHHADFDIAKTGFFKKLVQLHFTETEPAIGVKFPRSLKSMAQQIEHDDAAIPFQNPMRGGDSALRLDGMMEGLA